MGDRAAKDGLFAAVGKVLGKAKSDSSCWTCSVKDRAA